MNENECLGCCQQMDAQGRTTWTSRIGAHELEVGDIPATICRNCDVPWVTLEDVEAIDLAVAGRLIQIGVREGALLHWSRKALGLTRQELADSLGVTVQDVETYELASFVSDESMLAVERLILESLQKLPWQPTQISIKS